MNDFEFNSALVSIVCQAKRPNGKLCERLAKKGSKHCGRHGGKDRAGTIGPGEHKIYAKRELEREVFENPEKIEAAQKKDEEIRQQIEARRQYYERIRQREIEREAHAVDRRKQQQIKKDHDKRRRERTRELRRKEPVGGGVFCDRQDLTASLDQIDKFVDENHHITGYRIESGKLDKIVLRKLQRLKENLDKHGLEPSVQHLKFVHCYFMGWTARQIAEEYDCGSNYVRSIIRFFQGRVPNHWRVTVNKRKVQSVENRKLSWQYKMARMKNLPNLLEGISHYEPFVWRCSPRDYTDEYIDVIDTLIRNGYSIEQIKETFQEKFDRKHVAGFRRLLWPIYENLIKEGRCRGVHFFIPKDFKESKSKPFGRRRKEAAEKAKEVLGINRSVYSRLCQIACKKLKPKEKLSRAKQTFRIAV